MRLCRTIQVGKEASEWSQANSLGDMKDCQFGIWLLGRRMKTLSLEVSLVSLSGLMTV